MINYKTKEDYLCSWFENEPNYFNRKIYYIGLTKGLGGYHQLLNKGFVDKRFHQSEIYLSKTKRFIINKINIIKDEIRRKFNSMDKEDFEVFLKDYIETQINPYKTIIENNFKDIL